MRLLDYDLILSDIDGVILREGEPIWGNLEGMKRLAEAGKRIILISNNSGLSRVLVSRQLRSLGLIIEPQNVITSGVAAAYYLKNHTSVKTTFVVGEEGLVEELRNFGFLTLSESEASKRGVDGVIVGLDRFVTYERLSLAMKLIKDGALFLATNEDRLWPSKDGFKLGAGALVHAISYSLNRDPDVVVGKPNKWIVETAVQLVGLDLMKRAVIIGDQLDIDIKMGNQMGIDTVLVLTGLSTEEDAKKALYKPTAVVQEITQIL